MNFARWGLVLGLAPLAAACGSESTTSEEVLTQYADNVHAAYSESLNKAKEMQTAIDAFVAAPSEAGFKAAKDSWKAARVPYGQTEAFRFYDGPIDNATDGPEGQLNAWPMNEAYVDYVEGSTTSGIVNATNIMITKEKLSGLNEGGEGDIFGEGAAFDADAAVSTGYHAIEFLLWGQDRFADSAGKRPYTDYLTDASATAPNGDRRGTYLKMATELLIDDLQKMVDAWAPGQENYRKTFLAGDADQNLRNIIAAIGILAKGELGGERMDVALSTNDQEDEHSCFADNTHVDIQMNLKGIQNVYLGVYGSTDGPGIYELVKDKDSELAENIKTLLETATTQAGAMPVPFDQAISVKDSDDWKKINEVVQSLFNAGDEIAKIGPALELGTISVKLPE